MYVCMYVCMYVRTVELRVAPSSKFTAKGCLPGPQKYAHYRPFGLLCVHGIGPLFHILLGSRYLAPDMGVSRNQGP